MARLKVNIRGVQRTIKAVERYGDDFVDCAFKEITKSAIRVQTEAKKRLTEQKAVDTGRLRSSVATDFSKLELEASVFTDVEYGPFIELGTSRMPARPYLFPSLEKERPKLGRALKRCARRPR